MFLQKAIALCIKTYASSNLNYLAGVRVIRVLDKPAVD